MELIRVGTPEVEMEWLAVDFSGEGAPWEGHCISCSLSIAGFTCSTLGPHLSGAFFSSQTINRGTLVTDV